MSQSKSRPFQSGSAADGCGPEIGRQLGNCKEQLLQIRTLLNNQHLTETADSIKDPKLQELTAQHKAARKRLESARCDAFKTAMYAGAGFIPTHARSIVTFDAMHLKTKNATNQKVIKKTLETHAKLSTETQTLTLKAQKARVTFETKRVAAVETLINEYSMKYTKSLQTSAYDKNTIRALQRDHAAETNLLHRRNTQALIQGEESFMKFRHKTVLQFHSLSKSIQLVHQDTGDCNWTDVLDAAEKDKAERKSRQWTDSIDAPEEDDVDMKVRGDKFKYSASEAALPEIHRVKFAKFDQKRTIVRMMGNEHDKHALKKESEKRAKETKRQQEKSQNKDKGTYVIPQKRQKSKTSRGKRGRGGKGKGGKRPRHRDKDQNSRRGSK